MLRYLYSVVAIVVAPIAWAQEPEAPPAAPAVAVQTEVVLEGLQNPCGVAIQPDTGTVFVADSGNAKIVRVVDGKAEDVIVEFDKQPFGDGPTFEIGPLGMVFLDAQTLVVGCGGKPDGEDAVMVFKVPDPGAPAIKAEAAESKLSLPAEGDMPGEGDFFSITATPSGVYVSCQGDDAKGWIARADRDGVNLTNFRRHIATKDVSGVAAPGGLAMTVDQYLTVGQMGDLKTAEDSVLVFYGEDGKEAGKYPTKLNDIVALAYGTTRTPQRLFALDFSWMDPSKGGLYKLVAVNEGKECEARKITDLDKPTAMVFDSAGALYVTVIGTAPEGSSEPSGKLLKITGVDQPDAPQPPAEPPKDGQ